MSKNISYDLAYVKGKSFASETTAEVLQMVADFAKEQSENITILCVNLGYTEGDVTADVMYE